MGLSVTRQEVLQGYSDQCDKCEARWDYEVIQQPLGKRPRKLRLCYKCAKMPEPEFYSNTQSTRRGGSEQD